LGHVRQPAPRAVLPLNAEREAPARDGVESLGDARAGSGARDASWHADMKWPSKHAARDRDRAEEMRAHVELYVDELVARGRTPEDARREARLAFGNPRAKLEEVRQMSRLPIIDALWRDAKYAVRVLRRTPAFTTTAVVTLALVIGANSAVFSLAAAILLKPLPYPHPERLAVLGTRVGLGPDEVDPSQDGRIWESVHGRLETLDFALGAGNFGHNVNLVADNVASSVGQWRVSAGYFH